MLPSYSETDTLPAQRAAPKLSPGTSELFSAFSASFFSESKKRAESAYKTYGKIDILRPYFDVEPKDVINRVIHSFDPRPFSSVEEIISDLYAPFMACLTLIAVLLFEMKLAYHEVQEGTLMGSAIVTCFGYWFLAAGFLTVIAYIGNSSLTYVQILSAIGYALCSTCIVLCISSLTHHFSEGIFFILWCSICGAASTKIALLMWKFIPGGRERIAGAILTFVLHMGFVLYLHFAYHRIVAEDNRQAVIGP